METIPGRRDGAGPWAPGQTDAGQPAPRAAPARLLAAAAIRSAATGLGEGASFCGCGSLVCRDLLRSGRRDAELRGTVPGSAGCERRRRVRGLSAQDSLAA